MVGVQHGAAAMTDCGLIPALLNVVQLNMDGQVGGDRENKGTIYKADALFLFSRIGLVWIVMVWCGFGVDCGGLVSCGWVLVLVLVDFFRHGLRRCGFVWIGLVSCGFVWFLSPGLDWSALVAFGFFLLWFAVESCGLVSCG